MPPPPCGGRIDAHSNSGQGAGSMIVPVEMQRTRPMTLHGSVVSTTTDVWDMLSAEREGYLTECLQLGHPEPPARHLPVQLHSPAAFCGTETDTCPWFARWSTGANRSALQDLSVWRHLSHHGPGPWPRGNRIRVSRSPRPRELTRTGWKPATLTMGRTWDQEPLRQGCTRAIARTSNES